MLQRFLQWNTAIRKLLWWIVIASIVAAIPIIALRVQAEQSAKQVEFVMDYRDILDISDYKSDPTAFVAEQLDKLKAAGINSVAVFESTLDELRKSRRIKLYNSQEAATLEQRTINTNENNTYVLFANEETRNQLQPIMEREYARYDIGVRTWSYQGQHGLILSAPPEVAKTIMLAPDPLTLAMLDGKGFQIVARLGDQRQPFDPESAKAIMEELHRYGVKRIIFDGLAVTGFGDPKNAVSLSLMAGLMNKYDIGMATVENTSQKGENKLAYLTDYNVVRLISIPDKIASKSVDTLSDMISLAVKDRNIRMIYLHAQPAKDPDRKLIVDQLDNIYKTVHGKDGAIARIESMGYTVGPAQPMKYEIPTWHKALMLVVWLGAVALIALMIAEFMPAVLLPVFIIGLLGSLALYVKSHSLLLQGLALGASISAPTIAVLWVIKRMERRWANTGAAEPGLPGHLSASGRPGVSGMAALASTGIYFAVAFVISLFGAVYVAGLLNQITYFLVLEQFRGVSALHIAPMVLVGVYMLLFREKQSLGAAIAKARKLLMLDIKVLWVLIACIAAVAGWYYLSRTGNEGQVSSVERLFRSLLENTIGVRPRNKEIFIGHPLFVIAVYFGFKYKNALYLLIVGAMGQLSMVDTFAHLHTPIAISATRDVLGLVIGFIIGIIAVAIIELLLKGWRKWDPLRNA